MLGRVSKVILIAALTYGISAPHLAWAGVPYVAISRTKSNPRLAVLIEHSDGTFTLVMNGVPQTLSSKRVAEDSIRLAEDQGKSVVYEYDDPHEH